MKVLELWRYPVKSLQGEQLDVASITPTGLDGDRAFAIFDEETGLGLTARRVPELLFASASVDADGDVDITLPDGTVTHDERVLSEWLARPVTLRSAEVPMERLYENPLDFEHEATSDWMQFTGSGGAFHDSSHAHVSLVSAATIGAWDRRRFRANVLVDEHGEDDLVGSRAQIGESVLDVTTRIPRCVMTTRPQPGGIERDLDVLRTINRDRHGCLAVAARVVQPGTVRVGDVVGPVS